MYITIFMTANNRMHELHVEKHSVLSHVYSFEDLTQPIDHRYRKKVLPKFLRKSNKIIFARRECEKSQ